MQTTTSFETTPDLTASPMIVASGVRKTYRSGPVVVDTGKLCALNPLNGAVREAIPIGHAQHFTTRTIAGGTVIMASDAIIQAFRHA
jgi:hypothetical protein